METSSHRAAAASKSPMLRSKVTNGRRVFAIGGDGSSAWTRRWKDLYEAHVSDLGGMDAGFSEGQISLCRRVAAIEIQLEQMEAKMSEGDLSADMDQYSRIAQRLHAILAGLGLKRVAKPVDLRGYLRPVDKP
jgi:hypothetical protein